MAVEKKKKKKRCCGRRRVGMENIGQWIEIIMTAVDVRVKGNRWLQTPGGSRDNLTIASAPVVLSSYRIINYTSLLIRLFLKTTCKRCSLVSGQFDGIEYNGPVYN